MYDVPRQLFTAISSITPNKNRALFSRIFKYKKSTTFISSACLYADLSRGRFYVVLAAFLYLVVRFARLRFGLVPVSFTVVATMMVHLLILALQRSL